MIYLDNSTTKYDLFGNYARQIYGASVDKDVHRDIYLVSERCQSFNKNTMKS